MMSSNLKTLPLSVTASAQHLASEMVILQKSQLSVFSLMGTASWLTQEEKVNSATASAAMGAVFLNLRNSPDSLRTAATATQKSQSAATHPHLGLNKRQIEQLFVAD